MSWSTFLGLERGTDTAGTRLRVREGLTGGVGQLFGGVAFGAAVALLEERLERPAVWASGQFISNAFPDEVLDLDVEVPAVGRNFGQARVVLRVGDREVLTVSAALGSKSFRSDRSWHAMPAVPAPGQCELLPPLRSEGAGLHTRIEQRIHVWPDGAPSGPDGETLVWMRLPDALSGSSLGLAVIGDFLPLGFRNVLGGDLFGVSLDNTMRFLRRADTDWVLAEIRADALVAGVGHGTVRMWSPAGDLLAIASQTCSMRELDLPPA